MKVLVCGDRNYADKEAIKRTLLDLLRAYDITCIIEGEAKGADTLGRIVAEELGITVEKYPADWLKYGRSAGPIRNRQMLVEGKPNLVIAFHDDIEHSKGTKNMLEQARKAGVPRRLIANGKEAEVPTTPQGAPDEG